ncbi:MAG: pyridoxamine 5'-phosphate oxidase family protein [Deltaproteobacteria bacterium]|nr:pyridoxamine 5'-phosphate oxidase family protein [Deltaproteobacteria bacterium]
MTDIKLRISEYLKNHRKMTLATVNAQGNPLAHTVEYVSVGDDVYFATRKDTRKAENIRQNSHVAYTVDEDYADWMKIQGVQMEGEAFVVTDEAMIKQVYGLYIEKFPFVADFPPNPELIFVGIKPRVASFLDYEKGFAHRDKVVY